MEPPGGARHRWENREVEWAGAHESMRATSEFQAGNAGKELARASYQAAVIASGYSFAPERRTATLLQVANFKRRPG